MKLRQRVAPLLLLLPVLAYAASLPATEAKSDKTSRDGPSKPKYDNPFKPHDRIDGKPHDGPFVDPHKGDEVDDSDKSSHKADTKSNSAKKYYDGKKIPVTNDGVMDDPHRQLPKQGTTGTGGGVSEKDQKRKAHEGQTGEKLEKVPETPKEAPPLPHTEVEKIINSGKDAKKTAGLDKPAVLPGKSLTTIITLPNMADKEKLFPPKDKDRPSTGESGGTGIDGTEGIIRPFHSFVLSLTMILFSEIGDKTFLVAALMAMKHDRMLVFSAAFGALLVMTVLSAVLGHTVPALIPKRITAFLAAGLFLIFGLKMLREGLAMSPDEGVTAELQEVEMELQEKEHQALKQDRRRASVSPYAMEMGLGGTRKSRSLSRFPTPPRSPSTSPARSPSPRGGVMGGIGQGVTNLCSLLLSPAWVQTFIMTFLGEWGDRSQIATIAMAAGQDWYWVTLGAAFGHACCTGVAVIGGRAIAGKVSLKVVTVGGAIAFLVFGVIYFVEALYA